MGISIDSIVACSTPGPHISCYRRLNSSLMLLSANVAKTIIRQSSNHTSSKSMLPSNTMGSRPRPIHKNVIFIVFILVTCVFTTFSMIIYSQLDDETPDDDLVLRGSEEQHRRRKRKNKSEKKKKEKMPDQAELYLDDEPLSAIDKFKQDQEKDRQRRIEKGIASPREIFEQERFDPDDWERIQESVQGLRQAEIPTQSDVPYDIYNCPLDPPANYPYTWNVMNVLENWNPDDTELPTTIYNGLCVFDWNKENDDKKAENYRQQEVPFILTNYPELLKTSERWSTPGYLEELLGDEKNVNEHSRGSHFMYWKTKSPRAGFEPPTDTVDMTYAQWLEKAKKVEASRRQKEEEHWYYRLNAMLHNHAYLYEELPFFDPAKGRSMTVVKPEEHRGINCRFGMKGTVAESHYDSHNNFIAVMGGQRRYILAHPDQCENMELYPVGHPSARHSRIDFSKAYYLWRDSDRPFVSTQVNEVLLQPGDILYLPTYWFHFIVSLNTTYQCNSRSGESKVYQPHINKCGFGKKKSA